MIAVARRTDAAAVAAAGSAHEAETGLELLGMVGLEDPPREGVAASLVACRQAGIRVAMLTGDHPETARSIAIEIGLLPPGGLVVEGRALPAAEDNLGALLDRDGVVVSRVTPEDKLRITRALQRRGHVVAMTGDGVNDGPALREADIGIAMGASGTDVAREAADLVLLDDAFTTVVAAIELGRATFANIRRFLTYHLTDNVAELTPFVVWALSAGNVPLAIGVLQVLALDIGTDLLPALALGAEPPSRRTLLRPVASRALLDGPLLRRAFLLLGPVEAAVAMASFVAVLMAGGWAWGEQPPAALLGAASGTAFTAVVLGQLANAFACRSETAAVTELGWTGNPLLVWAVAAELVVLAAFLWLPPLPGLLGGSPPTALGWAIAVAAVPVVLLADATAKAVRYRRRSGSVGVGVGTADVTPTGSISSREK